MGSDKPDYTLGINILAQELANLTAVVTATALDIRLLGSQDIAHAGLPYNYEFLYYENDATVDDQDSDDENFSESDWGTGKDFYAVSIAYQILITSAMANNAYVKFYQGFRFEIQETRDSAPHPYVEKFQVNPMTHPPTQEASSFWIIGNRLLSNNKFDSGNLLKFKISNECGKNLGALSIKCTILGMAV